jgi:hypothetical protein
MPEKLLRLTPTLLLLSVFIPLVNCKSQGTPVVQEKKLEDVARERLGKKYELAYNASKTYALCRQQREADHPQRNFNYVVIRLADQQIVQEGSFRLGHVKWKDDTSIEVLNSSIRDEQGEKKIIRIDTDQH